MLEALGNRGSQAAGPTITELIAGLRGLKELSGNGSSLVGVKELLDVADKIVALRGDGTDSEDSSFGGVLKSIAKSIGPELAQALSQILVARNGPTSGASLPVDVAATTTASDVKVETPVIATMPLPTAYDQIAGQLCGLIDRLQAQV